MSKWQQIEHDVEMIEPEENGKKTEKKEKKIKKAKKEKKEETGEKSVVGQMKAGAAVLTAFLLGCACGRYFPYGQFDGTIEVLASSEKENAAEKQSETDIITGVIEKEIEEEITDTDTVKIEETKDKQELEPFAEIPNITVGKPVNYSFNQAVQQLKSKVSADERYQEILDRVEEFPEKLIINLANNPEMIAFVADYDGSSDDDSNAVLTESELKQKCPLFLQWDKRWGYLSYGDDSNIAVSGCGPTTLSMAVVGLLGNKEATPAAIAAYAMEKGYYLDGTGTKWTLMSTGAEEFGLHSSVINNSEQEMKEHLDEGGFVVCSMRSGDFTTGGHFILIYDYDDDGFLINDPFCLFKSRQKWQYSQLKSQIKAAWALNS